MKITEERLNSVIAECVKRHLQEAWDGKVMATKAQKNQYKKITGKDLPNDTTCHDAGNMIEKASKKITESKLNAIISESIYKYLSTINESIFDESMFGESEKNSTEGVKSTKSNDESSKKRQRVISYLKQDGVDIAQYAYQLWPDKDEDSGRSYFYKCLDGKLNDSGEHYRFSDDEVNRLYSMISTDSI